ncbi:hypothetical protein PHLCEN_2v3546 [Hermanssonia centrifuga]|uniref:Uncharacterized protein n=1 Tax=Hermanssonia centrifuga TaxID=98765 RepID=A0A2R6QES9_9APHY|nr:hypothetical protein PHLCEN_2v3546 [Hermanssonia centrifuga]
MESAHASLPSGGLRFLKGGLVDCALDMPLEIGPKAFIALWVLSAIPCILLAGRWKYAAIILAGVTG